MNTISIHEKEKEKYNFGLKRICVLFSNQGRAHKLSTNYMYTQIISSVAFIYRQYPFSIWVQVFVILKRCIYKFTVFFFFFFSQLKFLNVRINMRGVVPNSSSFPSHPFLPHVPIWIVHSSHRLINSLIVRLI